jgi:ferredoxin-NADP reductase
MYDSPMDEPEERPVPLISPTNMIPVRVIRREEIAPQVIAFFIALPGTSQSPAPFLPGQFVTLAIPTPNDTLYRSYSLCSDGSHDEPWEITIKRVREGAVSTYLHDHVKAGTLLYSSLPRGAFTLPADVGPYTPLVFVAAGSGVTPIIGMLRAIRNMYPEDRPPVLLHYASRTREDIIYRRELAMMDPQRTWLRQYHYISTEGQRMTADLVVRSAGRAAARAHWYMCGPESLKTEIEEELLPFRVPERQIHSEVFATQRGTGAMRYRVAEKQSDGNVQSYIRVAATDAVLGVEAGETVLAALERHGYHPDFSCRAGACGMCKLKMLSGAVEPAGGPGLSNGDKAAGYILSCIAQPKGDISLATAGKPPAGVTGVHPAITAGLRSPSRLYLRAGMVAATSMLAFGMWQLTNHRPWSWGTPSYAAAPPPTATTGTNSQGTPNGSGGGGAGKTPTAASGGPKATATSPGGGPAPTATSPAGGPTATATKTGGGPPPTATSVPPTPTPKPAPKPTATSTPS